MKYLPSVRNVNNLLCEDAAEFSPESAVQLVADWKGMRKGWRQSAIGARGRSFGSLPQLISSEAEGLRTHFPAGGFPIGSYFAETPKTQKEEGTADDNSNRPGTNIDKIFPQKIIIRYL